MKKILFLLIALTSLSSCHHKPAAQLVQADSLLSAYKVSEAQAILKRFDAKHQRKNIADSMYYKLLCTDAQNRCFKPFTAGADSTFIPVYNYYTTKGSIFQQMRANYLMGCIYRDLGWHTESQRYLHEAVAISEKHDKHEREENRLLSRVYGQLGEIYRYRTQIDLSIDMYNNAMRSAIAGGDSTMKYSAMIQLASCSSSLGDYHSAITNYQNCYQYFNHLHQADAYDCLLQIAGCYIFCEEEDSARIYITAYEDNLNIRAPFYITKDELNNFTYYMYKGDYYYTRHDIKSAITYYQRLCNAQDKIYHETGYKMLANCYSFLDEKDSVIKYQQLYIDQIIETNKLDNSKQLQELNSTFNVLSEKEKTHSVKIAKQRILLFTLSCLCILSTVCIILTLLYTRKKRNYIKLATKFNATIDNSKKQRRIILDLCKQNKSIKKQILESKKKIKNDFESEFEGEDLVKVRLEYFQTNSVVRNFYSKSVDNIRIEESDWQKLTECIEQVSPSLIYFLQRHRYNMEDTDYKICLLVIVGIPPKFMKLILNCTAQKISMQRKRLLKKIFNIDGLPCDFDYKLRSFKSTDNQQE